MIIRYFFLLGFTFACLNLKAQYFNYRMYDFTKQRVNPAYAAADNFFSVDLIHRRQNTSSEYAFETNNIAVKYPILNTIRLWSGISLSFLNDVEGKNNIYKLTQYNLGYAINVPVKRLSVLTFGLQGSYSSRSLNNTGLTTGAQFVEYRGFDSGLPSGELISLVQNNAFYGLDAGLLLTSLNRRKLFKQEIGLSVFNLNKPTIISNEVSENVEPTAILHFRRVVYEELKLRVVPEVLVNLNANGNLLYGGARFKYYPENIQNKDHHFDLITKFSLTSELMTAIQYHKSNLSFGFSYDLGLFNKNISNTGSIEVAFTFRKELYLKPANENKNGEAVIPHFTIDKIASINPELSTADSPFSPDTIDFNKGKFKVSSSLDKEAKSGRIQYLTHLVESPSYNFQFGFNEATLSKNDKEYLFTIIEILEQHKEVRIEITGHTDNVGSPEFNLELGTKRAMLIQQYLINNDVDKNQITLLSKGEQNPMHSNSTTEGRAKNRRVELRLNFY